MLLQAVQLGEGVEAGRPWVAQSSADFLQGLYVFLSMGLVLICFFFFCFERRCTSVCLGTCKGRVSCGGEAKAEEVEKITAWEKKKRAFAYIWEGC